MRQDMRKLKRYCQIVMIASLSFSLQACSMGSKMAMDYLPDTAKSLIDKDIQNGHQVDGDGKNSVSVKSMLASLIGFDDESESKIPAIVPAIVKEPITTVSLIPSPIKAEDLITPAFNNAPVPLKKPARIAIRSEILDVIALPFDKQTLSNIKQQIRNYAGNNVIAEISIGPVAEAEDIYLASLQAMAKANLIGKKLKNDFARVSIKFDPLLPRNTLKIVIKGKKRNA